MPDYTKKEKYAILKAWNKGVKLNIHFTYTYVTFIHHFIKTENSRKNNKTLKT